jgi:hypothetical protein
MVFFKRKVVLAAAVVSVIEAVLIAIVTVDQ